jgi:D-serine deaminase-like pyridoxal phosphate-dependent protein
MSTDEDLHRALVGEAGSRTRLNTPVLIVDVDALDRNIGAMQALAAAGGVKLRPHAKTHKSIDIARRQIAAGAVGQCCAKIGEAEVLAAGGVSGLLITSPVAAPGAIARLAALAARAPDLMAVVDSPEVAARIDAALGTAGARLHVLIDIDPGIRRTGVASAEAAVALAEVIAAARNLELAGVQFYCGLQQHIPGFADRRAAILERTDYLSAVVAALRAAGHAVPVISGSGTGTHRIDLELGIFTELQVGSYIFMDRQYLDCDLAGGAAGPLEPAPFEPALFVDARVVSANHAGLVTIDAGFKSLSTDGGSAQVVHGAAPDTAVFFMGDEHAALVADGIGARLRPGDPVSLTVPHCDPTVNLYDSYHVVRDGTLIDIWPVSARGRAR